MRLEKKTSKNTSAFFILHIKGLQKYTLYNILYIKLVLVKR